MTGDITDVLDDWEYDPENNIRIIHASDGRQVLQLRQPLGIEQYELDGRPDRQRPFGKESVLEELLDRIGDRDPAQEAPFCISDEDLELLQYEGIIYYYRYLLLFQIGEFGRTARDTEHNMKICEIVDKFAHNDSNKNELLQYRPYILRMNAVSKAMVSLRQQMRSEAETILESAIQDIEEMAEVATESFTMERTRSLTYLKDVLRQVREDKSSPVDKLNEELKQAVEEENYERAAHLRDQIRELQQGNEP